MIVLGDEQQLVPDLLEPTVDLGLGLRVEPRFRARVSGQG